MLTGCSLNTKQKLNGQVFLSVIFFCGGNFQNRRGGYHPPVFI